MMTKKIMDEISITVNGMAFTFVREKPYMSHMNGAKSDILEMKTPTNLNPTKGGNLFHESKAKVLEKQVGTELCKLATLVSGLLYS